MYNSYPDIHTQYRCCVLPLYAGSYLWTVLFQLPTPS